MGFQDRSDETSHEVGVTLKVALLNDNAGAQKGKAVQFAKNIESHPSEAGGVVANDQRAVDGSSLQRLADDPHVAEAGDDEIVFVRVESQLLKSQHAGHPAGTAYAGDTNTFAAQILGLFNV